MPARSKTRDARRAPAPETEENARAGRHADQLGTGHMAGERPQPAEPDELETVAYRAERNQARAEGRMQGIERHDKGHYHAAAAQGEGDPHSYPPGFNWGPRSGYAEEQPSGAPYNLSNDGDGFVQWREQRLRELDRAFHRWRAELSHQLDENYKRWIDTQQQAFTEEFNRWQTERRDAEGTPAARSRRPARKR